MKSLVTYFSQTGNTKMIADAMYERLSSYIEVEISSIREVDISKINGYDLVIVGGPCHDSDLAQPVKGFLERLPDSPNFKLAGFFTHATYMPDDDDDRRQELYDKWAGLCASSFETISKAKEIEFLGYFHCMGKASPPIEAFIRREIITNDDEWNVYLPIVRKHPTVVDLESAKDFVRNIIQNL